MQVRIYKGLLWLMPLLLMGCNPQHKEIQGYMEAHLAYVSVPFSGVLETLLVTEGDQVAKDQSLFVLDPQPEKAELEKSRADLKQAEAEKQSAIARLKHQELVMQRRESLIKKQFVSEETLDIARIDYKDALERVNAATAKVESLKAVLSQSVWTSQQKTVVAKDNALVFDIYYLPLELVAANQPVLALLYPDRIKVIFFVSEAQLSQVKLGQTISFSCLENKEISNAKISFISPNAEYTPPMLYATEANTKFVYRVEANPTILTSQCIHPGQPVKITLLQKKNHDRAN